VNLILLHTDEVSDGGLATLADGRATHLSRVLGVAPGDQVRVGLLDGPRGTATVTEVTQGAVALRCDFEATPPDRPLLDVLLAVPRPKVLRRLWSQLSALGIGRIILTNAEKVERNYFDTHILDEATYRPLLVEGLQQARDTRVPLVSVHRRLKVLVEDEMDALSNAQTRLVAHPGEPPIADLLTPTTTGRVLLAIGPEGGWTPFELDLLSRHGFRAVGMGPRTLRSDTATVALITLAHAALDSRVKDAVRIGACPDATG
jgi:RsmE family RNA methyltransferase